MQFYVNINQSALFELAQNAKVKVNCDHGLILSFLIEFSHHGMEAKMIGSKIFYRISYQKIVQENPLLKITNSQVVGRYINDLEKMGLVKKMVDQKAGGIVWISFGKNFARYSTKQAPLNSTIQPPSTPELNPPNSPVEPPSTPESTNHINQDQIKKENIKKKTFVFGFKGIDFEELKLTEDDIVKLQARFNITDQELMDHLETAENWMASKGNGSKYKNHRAFLSNWIKRVLDEKKKLQKATAPQINHEADMRTFENQKKNQDWDGQVDLSFLN